MKTSFKILATSFLMVISSGCLPLSMQIDNGIKEYESVADQIELGETKEKVLSLLLPSQEGIPKKNKRRPEKYLKKNVKVEIYYMRSARQPDGLTTDDEFVPYLFNDSKLVGIGWQVLGGPKTQGQTTTNVNVSNENTTIIY
jgi:hypothetical protein